MTKSRSARLFLRVTFALGFLAFFLPHTAQAQSPGQPSITQARITQPIDESSLVTLKGNTYPAATAKNDRGPVSPSLPMPDLTLVLSRSAEQQAAFDAFVSSEYDRTSPNYHQWLLPAEIGERFGPAQTDIATITGWLTSQGFSVKRVAQDGMTIKFAGTAAQVESAFHVQIHNLSVNGVPHYANMSDPQIPAALAPVVLGVKRLHNFLPHPLHKLGSKVQFNKEAGKWQRIVNTAAAGSKPAVPTLSLVPLSAASKARPQFGINGGSVADDDQYLEEDVTPWDFAKIYNLPSGWPTTSSANGNGQTIAIAGTSLIAQTSVGSQAYSGPGSEVSQSGSDVATYRSAFDLPALTSFQQINTGDGPTATECTSTSDDAVCGIGDLEENSLDVELSGAVATGASLVLVVTGQNSEGTVDTIYDSASYVVDNLTAKILNVSYGECELGSGTAENVAYYDLWQDAAAEGISVFVAAGDSGSPSCDDGMDEIYGNPYMAQYGLSVSGMASTPYNTAVGGTDFSWCQPYFNSSGTLEGCPLSSTTQTSNGENTAYWSTSNNSTTGESAANYVPEIPWNDTCENPILARYLETFLTYGFDVSGGSTPEEACNAVYNNWETIDAEYEEEEDEDPYIEDYVDTVGGSGGVSHCVVNSTNADSEAYGACSTGATSTGATTNPDTGASQSSVTLVNDGWPVPSWQQLDVTGMSSLNLTTRAIPDVSFFAGNGALGSATLICVSELGACTYSDTTENTAQEVGGTSVGTPELAGVMALIDQKTGAAQGLANPELYQLASLQTYSECSAETVKNSSSCYFNDIDNGPTAVSGPAYTNAQTNSMPCDLDDAPEGGDLNEQYTGTTSPNCTALNSGDVIGTLVTTQGGTTPAYNSVTGFDLATGLGSLNVANVLNAWTSDAGTGAATMKVTLSATTLPADTALTVSVTVTGSGSLGTPTGKVEVAGGGYSTTGTLSSGAATITIPANSLSPGSDTLTVTYSGDSNYASITQTASVTVSVDTPTVSVTSPNNPDNIVNALDVYVTVNGPTGGPSPVSSPASVSLSGGGYNSGAVTLTSSGTASGVASFVIPAGALAAGSYTLTATYSGNSEYSGATGMLNVTIVNTPAATATIKVTPASPTVDTGQSLGVTTTVSGAAGIPSGTATLTAGSYTSAATALDGGGNANFTVPANSLTAGTATLTVAYSGNAAYASGAGSGTVTVTQSGYTLAATSPAAVSIGGTATSTVTVTSTSDYNGTITLNCTATSGPANAIDLPTCTAGSTVIMTNGTANGTATLTIATTSASAMLHSRPEGKGWMGAGGAVLAFLVFLGIPARRRSWRSMLGILVLLVTLGSLSACGGGGGGGTAASGTTLGTYTMTVSGQGNDPAGTTATTTFTVTVN